jgi:DnaK suppressor protein
MKRSDFIRKMQQRLLTRRSFLRQALAGEVNSLQRTRDAGFGDEGDISLATAQDEIGSQMAEVESRELAQVERALEKMRTGRYGKCDNCNGAIGLARLQAMPNSTQCISCARGEERRTSANDFLSLGRRGTFSMSEDQEEISFDDAPLDRG